MWKPVVLEGVWQGNVPLGKGNSAIHDVHVLVIKQRAKSRKEEDRHVWWRVCKETGRPEWTVWEIILVVKKGEAPNISWPPSGSSSLKPCLRDPDAQLPSFYVLASLPDVFQEYRDKSRPT